MSARVSIARRVHRPDPGQQHRQAARVVADARREQLVADPPHFHVGPRREHRVQMRRDANQLAIADAAANARDIALRVDLQIRQPMLLRHLLPTPGHARFSLYEGDFDLGQPDDVLDGRAHARPPAFQPRGGTSRCRGYAGRSSRRECSYIRSLSGARSLNAATQFRQDAAAREEMSNDCSRKCNVCYRDCRACWV